MNNEFIKKIKNDVPAITFLDICFVGYKLQNKKSVKIRTNEFILIPVFCLFLYVVKNYNLEYLINFEIDKKTLTVINSLTYEELCDKYWSLMDSINKYKYKSKFKKDLINLKRTIYDNTKSNNKI